MRYLEWQLILLSPISPHICEHCWGLLGKSGTILQARFPQPTNNVDDNIFKQGMYIYSKVPHDFIKLKEKASKSGVPDSGVVYVAKDFPSWKVTILKILHVKYNAGTLPLVSQHDMKSNETAKQQWKDIITELMAEPSLKQFAKHVGGFASFVRDEAVEAGVGALDCSVAFDELALIRAHLPFLENKLNMKLDATMANDVTIAAHELRAKEAQPGKPTVVFDLPEGGKQTGGVGTKAKDSKNKSQLSTLQDLKQLNEYLSTRSYIENGAFVTAADFAQLAVTPANAPVDEFPHVVRWYQHIRFLEQRRQD